MEITVDTVLKNICADIQSQSLTETEWAEKESDDEYQSEKYCGGYDADEKAFCFSFYAPDQTEYWFQFSLSDASKIADGKLDRIQAREAE